MYRSQYKYSSYLTVFWVAPKVQLEGPWTLGCPLGITTHKLSCGLQFFYHACHLVLFSPWWGHFFVGWLTVISLLTLYVRSLSFSTNFYNSPWFYIWCCTLILQLLVASTASQHHLMSPPSTHYLMLSYSFRLLDWPLYRTHMNNQCVWITSEVVLTQPFNHILLWTYQSKLWF